jgi:hypothetical protein
LDEEMSPLCFPTRWPSPLNQSRGLVVIMHGYTACPSGYNRLSAAMQAEGFTVLSPLTVGHGKAFNKCSTADRCVSGDPVYDLPVRAEQYLEWVDKVKPAFVGVPSGTPAA